MIDIKLIRERPEWVKAQLAKLYFAQPLDGVINEIVALDTKRRVLIVQRDELRAQQKRRAKEFGKRKGVRG